MFAFSFNQGYISGIFSSYYLGFHFENVKTLETTEYENYVIEKFKNSDYYKKIKEKYPTIRFLGLIDNHNIKKIFMKT